MRLLGAKIGVDDQLLQGKAQIPDLHHIDRSLGGKGGLDRVNICIGAMNFRERASRPMRLGVDLCGNRTLPNAMLTHNQDWAVAFRNAGNCALNLRLNWSKWSALPFHALDGCIACHGGSSPTLVP